MRERFHRVRCGKREVFLGGLEYTKCAGKTKVTHRAEFDRKERKKGDGGGRESDSFSQSTPLRPSLDILLPALLPLPPLPPPIQHSVFTPHPPSEPKQSMFCFLPPAPPCVPEFPPSAYVVVAYHGKWHDCAKNGFLDLDGRGGEEGPPGHQRRDHHGRTWTWAMGGGFLHLG